MPVLRALDKLAKDGRDAVAKEMQECTSANEDQVNQILQLAEVKGSNAEVLSQLESMCAGSELAEEGLSQLRDVIAGAEAVGITDANLQVDVSIARGLDYYTGTIYETFLDDLPSIGSVCSGGRYDNLAQLYTKQELPGIGASLGLDRLLAAMQTLEMLPETRTTADVMIVQFSKEATAGLSDDGQSAAHSRHCDRGFPRREKVEPAV